MGKAAYSHVLMRFDRSSTQHIPAQFGARDRAPPAGWRLIWLCKLL